MDQRPSDSEDGRDDRPGLLRRLSRRTSVWHYLVALALLPSIGVTAIAGLFTAERVDEARAAERIEHAAEALQELDALRLAIETEAGSSVIPDTLAQFGTTPEVVNRLAGQTISVPLPQARAATDDALESVRGSVTPITAGAIGGVTDRLRALRIRVDGASGGTPAERRTRSWNVVTSYRQISTGIADLELLSTDAIVVGRYGSGSPAVLRAAADLEDISRVALLGGERATVFYLLYVAPPEAVPGLVQELRDVDAAYRNAAAAVPSVLAPSLRTAWQVFMTGADTMSFDRLVSGFLQQMQNGGTQPPAITQVLMTARAVGVATQGLIGLLLDAVDAVTASASSDRDAAVSRARTATLLTAALLGLTIAGLLVLGGTIRWRLRDLAKAAQRFSSGQLEPVTVRGPREIALASEGLNDAVLNLRRVTTTAERLAAGDLSAPDLRHAAPGPLGAAVHASVSRVADAIRERERLQQELSHQASHDSLTGLVNRAEGERLIAAALERARREGTRTGLLFVDLDHFKAVNDAHGHHAGDHVLQVSAARMEAQVRARDVVCRFGGDEFVILLDRVESEFAAIEIGEHLVAAISEPILFDGHELFVGASIGASTVESGAIGVEEFLGRADSAVYRAKAAGRGGVVAH